MLTALSAAAASAVSRVLYAMLTERMLSIVIMKILKNLAEKTTNSLDDEIVAELEKILGV